MAKIITTVGGAQVDTAIKKIGTGSLLCDGSGDWLQTPDDASLTFGSGDFTIECWLYRGTTGYSYFIGKATSDGDDINYIYIMNNDTVRGRFGPTKQTVSTGTITNDGNWHHLAYVRNGNTLRMYIDGVQDGTVDVTGVSEPALTSKFGIGITGEYAGAPLNGYLDEIRVSNICRYPDGTTFTPSTTAFTPDANTVLLVHCDGADASTVFTDDAYSAGTNMKINISDTWKAVSGAKINISDTWKTITHAKINVSDTWKTIF